MREKRNKLIHDMRQLLDSADREGRAMTTDEIGRYDAMETELQEIDRTLERMARLEASGARTVPASVGAGAVAGAVVGAAALAAAGARASGRASVEYAEAFGQYVRGYAPSEMLARESRVMNITTAASGGYAVPETWEPSIVQIRGEHNIMRGLATVRPMGSSKINVPVISARGSGGWTAESGAFNESDDTFAEVEINAWKGTRLMKVSEEMLSDSIFPVDSHIQESIGRSIGELEEAAFVNGDGSSKPTGIVGGSDLGKTAAGAAAITADELIDLQHSVARAYRTGPKVGWMMADSTVKLIRKLKDSDGQYLWRPGLADGEVDRLLGKPVYYSDNMPAATTGLKSVLFGDFSYYLIYDRPGVALQRLNELYSANGQIGFRAFIRTGGKLSLSAAVKHLIQA